MTRLMPAEWAPHDWMWIGFPGDRNEWPNELGKAQAQVAAFADAVHADGRGEHVLLVARTDADADKARALVAPGVEVVVERFGDIWLRDTAPIAAIEADERHLTDFDFNGWGGKFRMPGDEDIGTRLAARKGIEAARRSFILEGGAIDTDGEGLFVTTAQCVLNPNRNGGASREQVERALAETLGMRSMLWLGDGLTGDHTDGHVDNLARFVAPGTLAIPQATDQNDPNYLVYADAAARAIAHKVKVVRLPSAGRFLIDGQIAPASYMNFVIGNAAVVVPQYNLPTDEEAVDILRDLFPTREVVGLPSIAILRGGGSFHCCSMQMPSVPNDLAKEQ